jgi:hypothetical protein
MDVPWFFDILLIFLEAIIIVLSLFLILVWVIPLFLSGELRLMGKGNRNQHWMVSYQTIKLHFFKQTLSRAAAFFRLYEYQGAVTDGNQVFLSRCRVGEIAGDGRIGASAGLSTGEQRASFWRGRSEASLGHEKASQEGVGSYSLLATPASPFANAHAPPMFHFLPTRDFAAHN